MVSDDLTAVISRYLTYTNINTKRNRCKTDSHYHITGRLTQTHQS